MFKIHFPDTTFILGKSSSISLSDKTWRCGSQRQGGGEGRRQAGLWLQLVPAGRSPAPQAPPPGCPAVLCSGCVCVSAGPGPVFLGCGLRGCAFCCTSLSCVFMHHLQPALAALSGDPCWLMAPLPVFLLCFHSPFIKTLSPYYKGYYYISLL